MGYLEYEEQVIEALEEFGEMDRSDAQGVAMMQEDFIQDCYEKDIEIIRVVKRILGDEDEEVKENTNWNGVLK